MELQRLTGLSLIALGAGMAANALLGPLVLGIVEFRVSESAENQLLGGELVSLVLAAPMAVLAGALWLRGHRLAPLLAVGPAAYAVYTAVQFVVGPDYARYEGNNERAFPLYLALIVLGWASALRAWAELRAAALPPPPAGLRRALAALLIGLGTVFALAWAASLVDVLDGGGVSQAYRDDPTLFWLVRLMDLAFIIPAALVAGGGLWRGAAWATTLGYAVVAFLTLEVGAVASMAVAMGVRDDPAADPVLLVVAVVGTLALATLWGRLLWRAGQPAQRVDGQRSPASGVDERRVVSSRKELSV